MDEGGGARCIYGTGETFNYQLGALCTCDYRATGSEAVRVRPSEGNCLVIR